LGALTAEVISLLSCQQTKKLTQINTHGMGKTSQGLERATLELAGQGVALPPPRRTTRSELFGFMKILKMGLLLPIDVCLSK
jgi:hypothetical protein